MTLERLKFYVPEYRPQLTIPKTVRFGLEIELENVSIDKTYKLIRDNFNDNWRVSIDRSLIKGRSAEVATPPLYNNKDTWVLLKKLGKLLERLNPTFDNCSFQVNFDGSLLPSDKVKMRFLKLYSMYEDIIYRFSMGEFDSFRDSLEMYAYPIILHMKGFSNSEYAIEALTDQKRYGINFKSERDLIEFRTPNSTCNPMYWQNYITTFYYLIMYSLSPKCNEKELDSYIEHYSKLYILEHYGKENNDKAIELARKIFRKTDDQFAFLSQYIKK